MKLSPFAEIVPTWAISSFDVTFFEFLARSATTASTARSMPRFKSIGLRPAATALAPSRAIAAAMTVAVVVPSPARRAAWRRPRAPAGRRDSRTGRKARSPCDGHAILGDARGAKDFSITTLRPLGPSVTFTALLRIPRRAECGRARRWRTYVFGSHCIKLQGRSREVKRRRRVVRRRTPRTSLSFMMRRSSPSILTSEPDHFPNKYWSPTLRSSGTSLPLSSRAPGRRR